MIKIALLGAEGSATLESIWREIKRAVAAGSATLESIWHEIKRAVAAGNANLESIWREIKRAVVSPQRGTEILLAIFLIVIVAFVLRESE